MSQDEPIRARAEDGCEEDEGCFGWEGEVRLQKRRDAVRHGLCRDAEYLEAVMSEESANLCAAWLTCGCLFEVGSVR